MTDKVIIKALKEILEIMCAMGDLQKAGTISKAIDLINQQKAEIKELKKGINIELDNFASEYDEKIKAEAVKEFAERLKEEMDRKPFKFGSMQFVTRVATIPMIDNLLKETVGDTK